MKAVLAGFLTIATTVLSLTTAHADKIVRPDRSTVILEGGEARRPEAADMGRGVAVLGGVIGTDGSVQNNTGITSVNRFATGGYQIFFNRNVLDCIAATTLYGFTNAIVKIVARGANDIQFNTVRISDGVIADAAFGLVVFCPK